MASQDANLTGFNEFNFKLGEGEDNFDLGADLRELATTIRQIGSVQPVIIDPIVAHFGEVDPHQNAKMRAFLLPLKKMAEETGVAVLGIMHLNKSAAQEAVYR